MSRPENTPTTDWAALQKLKNEFLEGIPENHVEEFRKAGVTTLAGRATLAGPDEVEVNGDRYRADHIVLATGAVPRRSNFEGAELARGFMINYNLYRHYFPMMALGRARKHFRG